MQHNSTVGLFTMANIMAAQIFGIPVSRILEGIALTLLGVCGRIAVEAYYSYKYKGYVVWSKIFLLAGVGLLSAATITIGVLAALSALGVVKDNATILCLIFFGALGADGIQWFMDLAATFIQKKTGVRPPSITDEVPKP